MIYHSECRKSFALIDLNESINFYGTPKLTLNGLKCIDIIFKSNSENKNLIFYCPDCGKTFSEKEALIKCEGCGDLFSLEDIQISSSNAIFCDKCRKRYEVEGKKVTSYKFNKLVE